MLREMGMLNDVLVRVKVMQMFVGVEEEWKKQIWEG